MALAVYDSLRTAHARFLLVVAASALGALLCFPRASDAGYVRALRLSAAVAREVDPAQIASTLASQAELNNPATLSQLTAKVEGPGVRHLSAGNGRVQLWRAQPVSLVNLGALLTQARSGHEVTLRGPDLEGAAASLRWRLGRMGGAESSVLSDVRIVDGSANATQLSAEQAVEPLRIAAIEARRIHSRAEAHFDALDERVKAMTKARVARKALFRMGDKRREALAERDAARAAWESAQESYRKAADAALAFRAVPEGADLPGVVVVASVKHADGQQSVWQIPVARIERKVISPPVIVSSALTALASEPAWPELSSLTAVDAQALLRSRMSWHLEGGVFVLYGVPLLLLAALGLLVQAGRRVKQLYDPFAQGEEPPAMVGTGLGALDLSLIVIPVVGVVGLDTWTLLRIEAAWWVAVILGAVAIACAVVAAQRWQEVLTVRGRIERNTVPPRVA